MISRFLNANYPLGGEIDPFAHFDEILLSYYSWQDEQSVPKANFVAGDSGGFSVATVGAVLDPRDVILWQMKHADVGYILDSPPYDAGSATPRLDPELWPGCLDFTVANVKRAAPYYRPAETPFRWWGIVQGGTRGQQQEWHGEIASAYAFDGDGEGWAFRPYPNNSPVAIARCVRFAADSGMKNVHLLQTTGAAAVAVLLGLAKLAGMEFVSYDSASAGQLATNMLCLERPEAFPSFEIGHIKEVSRRGDTEVRDYMRSGECRCAGCSTFPADSLPNPTDYINRLLIHNYCVMRDNFAAIAGEAERDPEQLIRVAIGSDADAVFREFMR